MNALIRHAAALTMAAAGTIVTLAAQPAPPNTLTPAEIKEGWKLLFDGRTIDQWRGFKQKGVPSGWQVIDGAITWAGGGPDLISVEQYESFDFKFDWQVTPGANSGVMYHVSESEANTYDTGPEYQILDNARHADGKDPLTSAAACYALYAPPKDVTRPVGSWNEGQIVVENGRVQHWLNGQRTASFIKGSADWNARVAKSKFGVVPSFGKPTRGHLAIQEHGGKVAYRSLKIRILK